MTPRKPKKAKVVYGYVVVFGDEMLMWTYRTRAKYARGEASCGIGMSWPDLRRDGYRTIRVEVREVEK